MAASASAEHDAMVSFLSTHGEREEVSSAAAHWSQVVYVDPTAAPAPPPLCADMIRVRAFLFEDQSIGFRPSVLREIALLRLVANPSRRCLHVALDAASGGVLFVLPRKPWQSTVKMPATAVSIARSRKQTATVPKAGVALPRPHGTGSHALSSTLTAASLSSSSTSSFNASSALRSKAARIGPNPTVATASGSSAAAVAGGAASTTATASSVQARQVWFLE
jgi:hypothetical protein